MMVFFKSLNVSVIDNCSAVWVQVRVNLFQICSSPVSEDYTERIDFWDDSYGMF